MKVTKPTPAPWKVDEETGIVYAEFSNGTEPAICHTQASDTATLPFDESIANARLLAAAPELLEALKLSQELLQEAISHLPNSGYGWLQGKVDARIIKNRALLETLEK